MLSSIQFSPIERGGDLAFDQLIEHKDIFKVWTFAQLLIETSKAKRFLFKKKKKTSMTGLYKGIHWQKKAIRKMLKYEEFIN